MALTVGEVMTRELHTLSPNMTLKEMDHVLLQAGIGGAPVVENDRLVGVASQADVIRALYDEQEQAQKVMETYESPFPIPMASLEILARDSRKIADHMIKKKVAEIMSKNPVVVNPHIEIEYAAKLMSTEKIHRLPVVEEGKLVGVLTTLDIVSMVGTLGLQR